MRAGRLDQRVTIQHRTVTGQDSYGQDVVSWTASTSGPFWAEVAALEGRELANVQQKWAEARFRVTIRYQTGVTIRRRDRISWQSPERLLDILDAEDPNQARRKLIMICSELVD